MSRDVKAYLASKKTAPGDIELAQQWAEIEEFYTRRLWHQLTERLLTFVKHESFRYGGLVELYHNFLADFELKIKPLSLVEIIIIVTEEITESDEAVTFLEGIKEKVKNDLEALVLCMTKIGLIKLKCGQLDGVKSLLEEAGEVLDSMGGVTTVHARYYDLCSKYHKVKADYEAYYRDALRFLGCVDIKLLSGEEQTERAFSLSLAALMGENVYNFGELLAHPVLNSLRGTEKEWLIDLLYAFNAGSLQKYMDLRQYWEQQADLANSQDQLVRKIQLLSLMELVFSRHAHDRTISFSAIADAAQITVAQVEMLVMKALSLGLVKGTIDEVSQEVHMTWVQPRVLDLKQVASLQCRMDDWCKHIKDTANLVKDEVPEIVAS